MGMGKCRISKAGVAEVGKAASGMWKKLSAEKTVVYEAKAKTQKVRSC